MTMVRAWAGLAAFCLFAGVAAAERITISVDPPNASIYKLDNRGEGTLIGTGTATLKLESDSTNQVRFVAEGYEPLVKSFPKGRSYPSVVQITLINRLVKLQVRPYDAQITQNGVSLGSQAADIVVPQGKSTTVEIKKRAFLTKTKTYYNQAGFDVPPVTDSIELTDRVVLLTADPPGSVLSVDGKQVAETTGEVIVPKGNCATLKVAKTGYAPVEKTYCNKEQAAELLLTDSVTLRDRLVAVFASPSEATIKVNGRMVGKGEFQVKVNEGTCADVIVAHDGFVTEKRQYCNQANMPVPPADEHFQLQEDEAFQTSVRSDQANVNFTIEVGPKKAHEQAWKVLFQAIVNSFDIIEMSDKETGYLRTAWKVKTFPHSTIRTRVISYIGDSAPLKYVVKIQSEYSGEANTSVKCDDCFHEWDRLLNSYKNIITELQARLM